MEEMKIQGRIWESPEKTALSSFPGQHPRNPLSAFLPQFFNEPVAEQFFVAFRNGTVAAGHHAGFILEKFFEPVGLEATGCTAP